MKKSEQVEINLLVGKSRLVPCNKQVTLPRLQLSGALLLSKLMDKVKQALSTNLDIKIYGWIDSMAVLGWLQGSPDRWKSFVANRIRKITEIMPPDCWQYVKSFENPSDSASRGLTASQLQKHLLWWRGPTWLPSCENKKQDQPVYTTTEEQKQMKQCNVVTQDNDTPLLMNC